MSLLISDGIQAIGASSPVWHKCAYNYLRAGGIISIKWIIEAVNQGRCSSYTTCAHPWLASNRGPILRSTRRPEADG
jgi:hypothetical protein